MAPNANSDTSCPPSTHLSPIAHLFWGIGSWLYLEPDYSFVKSMGKTTVLFWSPSKFLSSLIVILPSFYQGWEACPWMAVLWLGACFLLQMVGWDHLQPSRMSRMWRSSFMLPPPSLLIARVSQKSRSNGVSDCGWNWTSSEEDFWLVMG